MLFYDLYKKRPEILFFVILACVICLGTLWVRAAALFGQNRLFIPAVPADRLIEPPVSASDTAQWVAEEKDVWYFRTPDDALCSWDGEKVSTLIKPGNFYGQYLYVEKGVLFYSDTKAFGLYACELESGLVEKIVDYSDLRGFRKGYSVFWWTDAEGYYFLSMQSEGIYRIWQTDALGENKDAVSLPERWWGTAAGFEEYPDELYSICAIMGDCLICTAPLEIQGNGQVIGGIGTYNYKTGEWKLLMECDGKELYGEPIGFRDGKLILPLAETGQYIAVDPVSGESELFAEVDDPLLRLETVGEEVIFARLKESGSADSAQTLGIWQDGQFTKIGRIGKDMSSSHGPTGNVYFITGYAGELFTDIAVTDLTGADSTADSRLSLYAVLSDGTVFRLYALEDD